MGMNLTEREMERYKSKGVTHILHCSDRFDYTRYNVEVTEDQIFDEERARINGKNMQTVDGVTYLVDQAEYQNTLEERKQRILKKQAVSLKAMEKDERERFLYRLPEERLRELLNHFIDLEKTS